MWINPVNFGPKINSEFDEYRPVVSDHPEFANRLIARPDFFRESSPQTVPEAIGDMICIIPFSMGLVGPKPRILAQKLTQSLMIFGQFW